METDLGTCQQEAATGIYLMVKTVSVLESTRQIPADEKEKKEKSKWLRFVSAKENTIRV